MGLTKRYYEYLTEDGMSLSSAVGESVCGSCFGDLGIRAFIRREGEGGRCRFCGARRSAVADLAEVIRFINECVHREYADPAERLPWCSAEGGYQGVVFSTSDLLAHIDVGADGELLDELEEGLGSDRLWCEDDPGAGPFAEQLADGWAALERRVKSERRFFFQRPSKRTDLGGLSTEDVLEALATGIRKLELIQEVASGSALHRVRVVAAGEVPPRTALRLGPPPSDRARMSNRMSPPGISMLYAAFSRKAALAECAAGSADRTFSATFRTTRPCKVIDLTRIPRTPSLFETDRVELRDSIRFLRHFAQEISKPIARDERVHVEYVPSQIVTEYLREAFTEEGVEGIVYASAQLRGGRNVAMFCGPEAIVPSAADVPGADDADWLFHSRHRDAWITLTRVREVHR